MCSVELWLASVLQYSRLFVLVPICGHWVSIVRRKKKPRRIVYRKRNGLWFLVSKRNNRENYSPVIQRVEMSHVHEQRIIDRIMTMSSQFHRSNEQIHRQDELLVHHVFHQLELVMMKQMFNQAHCASAKMSRCEPISKDPAIYFLCCTQILIINIQLTHWSTNEEKSNRFSRKTIFLFRISLWSN